MLSVLNPKLQSTNKKAQAVENDPAVINMGKILSSTHFENKYIHKTVKHMHLNVVSSSNSLCSIVKHIFRLIFLINGN